MVRPGDMVGERYQVIEQLATGGMGTVWRGRHLELDLDVALKFIAPGAADADVLKRFKREAKVVARLNSPNIVRVFDSGVIDGQPFFAMELLRGENLAEHLAREGRLPAERCARLLDSIARAVQCAHDAGIVHRDLKPANVFLERNGAEEVVKILDFGVAKDLSFAVGASALTTGATVLGSPAYMSPEQVWVVDVDSRADVWAMGVLSFELLTGKNPFAGEKLAEIFDRILRAPLPKLSAYAADLPPALDAFFERALSRNVSERIPSASEFALEFRRALAPGGTLAVPARVPVRTDPGSSTLALGDTERPRPPGLGPPRRKRAALALFFVLFVVGALVGWLVVLPTLAPARPLRPTAPATSHSVAMERSSRRVERRTAHDPTAQGDGTAPAPSSSPPVRPATPPVPGPPVQWRPGRVKQRARETSPVAAPAEPVEGATKPARVLDPKFGIPMSP